MKNKLCCSGSGACQKYGPLVLRIVVGIIFAIHGWQKISGGMDGVAGFLGSLSVPLPLFFAYVVTYVEFLGGIALILGIATRVAAQLLAINMVVALFLVHIPNGFFVSKGGYEFVLVLLAASVALSLTGPGAFAADSKCCALCSGEKKEEAPK